MACRLMSTPGRRFSALSVLLCVTCRDVGHVYRLTTALNHDFAVTRMGVSLTDGIILTVTVADSVLVAASCQTQVGVAMRIGRFLRQHDTDLASLQVVNVAFAPGRKDAAAPPRARLPIRFSPARIRAGLSASDSTDAVGSCTAYEDLGGQGASSLINGDTRRVAPPDSAVAFPGFANAPPSPSHTSPAPLSTAPTPDYATPPSRHDPATRDVAPRPTRRESIAFSTHWYLGNVRALQRTMRPRHPTHSFPLQGMRAFRQTDSVALPTMTAPLQAMRAPLRAMRAPLHTMRANPVSARS